MSKFILLCLFVVLFLGCFKQSVPEEVKTAHNALQKLKAATETGVNPNNYQQLIIEAKTAVNIAEATLPAISVEEAIKGEYKLTEDNFLSCLNIEMQGAMIAYQDAQTAWQHKIQNKELITSAEGRLIQKKYNIHYSEMGNEQVLQYLWHKAKLKTWGLQGLIASR